MKKFLSLLTAGSMAMSLTAVTLAQESSSSSSSANSSAASVASVSSSSKGPRKPAHVASCAELKGKARATCNLLKNPGLGNKKNLGEKIIRMNASSRSAAKITVNRASRRTLEVETRAKWNLKIRKAPPKFQSSRSSVSSVL